MTILAGLSPAGALIVRAGEPKVLNISLAQADGTTPQNLQGRAFALVIRKSSDVVPLHVLPAELASDGLYASVMMTAVQASAIYDDGQYVPLTYDIVENSGGASISRFSERVQVLRGPEMPSDIVPVWAMLPYTEAMIRPDALVISERGGQGDGQPALDAAELARAALADLEEVVADTRDATADARAFVIEQADNLAQVGQAVILTGQAVDASGLSATAAGQSAAKAGVGATLATGFPGASAYADLVAFFPQMAVGDGAVTDFADTGTHAAVAGEIGNGGFAVTAGTQIPNGGKFRKLAGQSAPFRLGNLDSQMTAAFAEQASAAALAASSKASADALEPGRRPIEAIPGIYAIYGMRRMVMTYSGPLVRLRKTVAGVTTEQNFGPASGSDLLDVTAITTWLGGAVGYVRSLYDQRGGERHWDQPAASGQQTLTISGAYAWITGSPGRKLLGSTGLLDFARYQDGNTAAILARVPAAPTSLRNLLQWSLGTAANAQRFSLATPANTAALSLTVRQYDDAGTIANNQPLTLNTWLRGIARADYRGGWLEDFVNGASTGPATLGTSGRSEDTASVGASINGSTTTDTGTDFDYAAIVLFQRALSTAEIKTLDGILATYSPDYVAPTRPSTIHLFGDEQFSNTGIADPAQRMAGQLGNLYETQDGTYRLVRGRGAVSNTSASVETRLIATPFTATDVIIVQAGIYDGLSASTANHDAALQNLQDMAANVTSGRYLISTIPFTRSETNGTTANTNKAAFNARVLSTFGPKAVDIAGILAANGGNSDGATPLVLLLASNSVLRNALGVAIEAAAYKAAIAAQGW